MLFRSSEFIPEFGEGFSNNVTVQRESTAFLNCPVKNPGDRPVSYPLVSTAYIYGFADIIQIIFTDILGPYSRLAYFDKWFGPVHYG